MTSAGVPQSEANDSGPLSEAPQGASVFDFLYHDVRRVGSFLAQFETYGVPSQVKATESASRSEGSRTTAGGGVDVLTFVKAQAGLEMTAGNEERDTAERTYDPLWTNARTLLDYLASHDLVQRDLWAARLGQFVLAQGTLIVLDLAMLRTAWEKPTVKKLLNRSSQHAVAARPHGGGKGQGGSNSDAQLLIEMLTILPHSIQAHLVGTNYSVWCTLSEESLTGLSSDLVLKHGAFVPGEWRMLGILDALPDPKYEAPAGETTPESIDEVVAANAGTSMGTVAAQLAPVARELLGRPRTSFGITPLLIFREVSG